MIYLKIQINSISKKLSIYNGCTGAVCTSGTKLYVFTYKNNINSMKNDANTHDTLFLTVFITYTNNIIIPKGITKPKNICNNNLHIFFC